MLKTVKNKILNATVKNKNINNINIVVLLIPIFIVNPLLGTLGVILLALYDKKGININCLIVFLSIFLALINTTKIPESDMLGYSFTYKLAHKEDFVSFIKTFNKEPVFYTQIFIFSNIGISFKGYIFIHTLISYIFYLNSIHKFQKAIPKSNLSAIFGIILGALFFELFSLSAHLVRQFLATSLLLYYSVEKLFYNKNKWWYLILALFVHTTTLLFVPFLFFSPLKSKLSITKGVTVIVSLLILIISVRIVSPIILNIFGYGILTYAFIKSSQAAYTDGISVSNIVILINVVLLSYGVFRSYISKKNNDNEVHFNHIIILLALFIFCMLSQPLIAYRFGFYSYFFLPFIVPVLINKKYFDFLTPAVRISTVFFLFGWFFYKLENGAFTYLKFDHLITRSIVNYFP